MYQFYKLKSALSGIINQGFPKAFSSSLYGVILTSKKLMEIRNLLKFMTQNHMKNGGWFNPLRNYKLLPGILQKTAKTKKILQPYKIQFDNFYLKIRENIEIASETSYGYLKEKSVNIFFEFSRQK